MSSNKNLEAIPDKILSTPGGALLYVVLYQRYEDQYAILCDSLELTIYIKQYKIQFISDMIRSYHHAPGHKEGFLPEFSSTSTMAELTRH